MKRFLPILPLAFLITACTSSPGEKQTQTLQSAQQNAASIDTTGLAQFQAWKAQNELAAATPVQEAQQPEEQVKTVTVIREVRVQQPAPVVRKTVKQQPPAPAQQRPEPVPQPQPEATPSAGSGDVASNSGSGSAGEASQPQEAAKEGGWSNSKKGAVIGAAGGAVIGAVINKKNRAAGAVIGGVLGGAAGYGLGKKKDNKEAQQ
ncbi:MAG TPA: glycine zipper domain-containing protein [Flavisolibacter sp.]|jgi:outer membrane biosynthesis protein TonB|nr:glycine zipper domain-containing protein [Flavisolibacter sp.]